MKLLYLTQGPTNACLQALLQSQSAGHEVVLADLAQGQWELVLDQVAQADQVISWVEEP